MLGYSSEKDQQHVKILIVDDEKYIADILVDIISEKARSVDVCYDGCNAINSIEKGLYDLIILDLVMPKVGGLDVLKYAKKANPDVLVVIITGHASIDTAVTAIKEGAYDYIRKPFKLDEIKIAVKNAVDKIRLNRENRDLLLKLQDAYHELMVLKEEKGEDKLTKINFFSSNMPNLHHVYNPSSAPNNYVDRLEALSSLRESGSLTEFEFKAFKSHLLKMIGTQQ
jgi:DNA-binding NtrC family response regulator